MIDTDMRFIIVISLIAISIFVFMLVAILVTRTPKGKKTEPVDKPPAEPFTAKVTTAPLEMDASLPEATPQPARLVPPEKHEFVLRADPAILDIAGVPLTSVLMVVLIHLLFLARGLVSENVSQEIMWGLLALMVVFGMAVGGAIGVRLAQLSWRQTVLAAILSGAGLMLISRFEISPFYPGPWDTPDRNFNPGVFIVGSLCLSVPVFLLPLIDPAVRKRGPAPATWMIAAAAPILAAILARLDQETSTKGLAMLVAGIFLSAFLLFTGLVASLIAPRNVIGAGLGGLGLLLLPLALAGWIFLGGGWFP